MLEPFRTFVCPPSEHRGQRLRPIVIIQRRQVPPAVVAAGQLHHARHQHQFKKEKLEQKERWSGHRSSRVGWPQQPHQLPWPKPPRREKNRQEASLQQQDVPLKAEKSLSGDRERKIEDKKDNQRKRWRDSQNQKQRKNNAATAKKMEKAITRIEPAKRGQ